MSPRTAERLRRPAGLPREVFERVGWFDESFFAWFETWTSAFAPSSRVSAAGYERPPWCITGVRPPRRRERRKLFLTVRTGLMLFFKTDAAPAASSCGARWCSPGLGRPRCWTGRP